MGKDLNMDRVQKAATRLMNLVENGFDEETRSMLDGLSYKTLIPLGIEPIDKLFRRIGSVFVVLGMASDEDINTIVEELAITAAHLDQLHAHASLPSALILIQEELPKSHEFRNVFMVESMKSGNKDYGFAEFANFIVEQSKEVYADENGICQEDKSVIDNCNNSLDQIKRITDNYEKTINNFYRNK